MWMLDLLECSSNIPTISFLLSLFYFHPFLEISSTFPFSIFYFLFLSTEFQLRSSNWVPFHFFFLKNSFQVRHLSKSWGLFESLEKNLPVSWKVGICCQVFWERQAEVAGADSHTNSPASVPYGIRNFRGPGTTKLEPVMWLLRLLSLPRMGLPLEGSKTTTAIVILNLLLVL